MAVWPVCETVLLSDCGEGSTENKFDNYSIVYYSINRQTNRQPKIKPNKFVQIDFGPNLDFNFRIRPRWGVGDSRKIQSRASLDRCVDGLYSALYGGRPITCS
jgi:hypothetical protein